MNITPKHGWMYVQWVCWGAGTKAQNELIEIASPTANPEDIISLKVLGIDPKPSDDDAKGFPVDTVVVARGMFFVPVEATANPLDDKQIKSITGLLRCQDVMAVVEDYAN